MPTALFVGFPAQGHTNPSLPLVQALVAVRRVLREPGFRDATGRIRESFATGGGAGRGADAIIAYAARR